MPLRPRAHPSPTLTHCPWRALPQRFPDAPRLTPEHLEALQAVTDAANDPELHLEWQLEPGDVQLLHNW